MAKVVPRGDVNGDGIVDNTSSAGSDRALVETAVLNANSENVPLFKIKMVSGNSLPWVSMSAVIPGDSLLNSVIRLV